MRLALVAVALYMRHVVVVDALRFQCDAKSFNQPLNVTDIFSCELIVALGVETAPVSRRDEGGLP